jgi:predicted DNA-binding protein (UPF0251 family)
MQRTGEGQCATRCYSPQCDLDDAGEPIILLAEEIAALNLVDLQGLEQEDAAQALGISRKTLWRDLKEARRKVAEALVNGWIIEVKECRRRSTEGCQRTNDFICPKKAGEFCDRQG